MRVVSYLVTSPSVPHPALRLVGLALALAMPAVPPILLGCSCVPERPSIRGCDDPITDFTGITSLRIIDAAVVRGPQGGRHIEFRAEAEGTGLRSCVAVRYAVHMPGEEVRFPDGQLGVSSDVSGSRVVTTPIYEFLDNAGIDYGQRTITLEALGRTATATVDVGSSPFGDDAAVIPDAAAAGERDAPSSEDAPALEDAPLPVDDAGASGDAA